MFFLLFDLLRQAADFCARLSAFPGLKMYLLFSVGHCCFCGLAYFLNSQCANGFRRYHYSVFVRLSGRAKESH